MTKKIIAFCTEISEFNENKIFDKGFAEKYIGAGIWPLFQETFTELGYEVMTGDAAIKAVKSRVLTASQIIVISDMHSAQGLWLTRRGAFPLVSLCLESPLIAVDFFDDLWRKRIFYNNYLILADESHFPNLKNITNVRRVNFPSLSDQEMHDRFIDDSHFLPRISFVAANKWIRYNPPQFDSFNPYEILKKTYITYRYYFSKSRKLQKTNDLHALRFKFVKHFLSKNMLDVAGPGWDQEASYPEEYKEWAQNFKKDSAYLGKISDKLKFLKQNAYSLCCENARFEGYVTEKIIHCLLVGTIPLYLGAPEINKRLDPSLFVDLTTIDLENLSLLINDKNKTEIFQKAIRNLGPEFFEPYTYSSFVNELKKLIEEVA